MKPTLAAVSKVESRFLVEQALRDAKRIIREARIKARIRGRIRPEKVRCK